MYKQSAGSRNHRSKGIKVKHAFQVCLLLGVCVWLVYQVKHSHDKKKGIDESDAKVSTKSESSSELVQRGRKEGLASNNEKREEEIIEEVNKREEEALEKDASDVEVDQEDPVEVDRERGLEDENSLDEDFGTSHEAREQNYKADDASSAVAHNTKVAALGNEHGGANVLNVTKRLNTTGLKVEHGEADVQGSSLNMTHNKDKGFNTISSEFPDSLVLNSTSTEGLTTNSTSTGLTVEETSSGGFNLSAASLQQGSSLVNMAENNKRDSNLTNTTLVDSSSVSANMDSLAEKAMQGNSTAGAVDKMRSALPLKDSNATEGDKSYNNDGVNADNLVRSST